MWLNAWVDGCTGGWVDGRMGERVGGRAEERVGGRAARVVVVVRSGVGADRSYFLFIYVVCSFILYFFMYVIVNYAFVVDLCRSLFL